VMNVQPKPFSLRPAAHRQILALSIVLACGSGCMTQTTTNETDAKVVKSRTIWIWQKDFWVHK
ncbi:MAG: hypothetical protein NTW03_22970, partial [Verrucomicrobia bacterium]|nr:hypothetical protein [Verrucomicrobiota bacterium]